MKTTSTIVLMLLLALFSQNSFAQCTGEQYIVNILTDNYPGETSWTIENSVSGTVVATSPAYTTASTQQTPDTVCLALDSCYTFTINDSYGDGICCAYGNGAYDVLDPLGTTIASGGAFAATETSSAFCTTASSPCPGATAAFTSAETGLTSTFTDASTGTVISAWAWDFGDGNTSTQQNPAHTYGIDGTYTVCLMVIDSCGTDTTCNAITVSAPPCNGPTAAFTSVETALTSTFTDASTSSLGILAWAWDLGDGNTSAVQNPVHTYAAAGSYLVCLTVTDSCDVNTICDTITVNVAGIDELFNDGLVVYPNPSYDVVNVTSNNQIESIQLINATGQVVMSVMDVNSAEYQLNGSKFAHGVYTLKVNTAENVITRRVILK